VALSQPEPRRRGRATLLIACAAVLGVVAGTVTGYAIQYDREPTPLPPLSQPGMRQPEPLADGKGPEPLSAAVDREVKTDGDLRKLLLPKPKDAQDLRGAPRPKSWVPLFSYAHDYEEPGSMFEDLADNGFRRVAASSWEQGNGLAVNISLVQFREETHVYSTDYLSGQQGYMPESKWAGNSGKAIPGTSDGRVYVYDKPRVEAGYLPLYTARALARRGDIVMDIWLFNSKPISGDTAMSLAKRQLERL
jgi:hypothetical protein